MAKVRFSIDDDDLRWLRRRARRVYPNEIDALAAELDRRGPPRGGRRREPS